MHDFSSKNQNIYNLKYIHPVYNENSPFTANPQKLQEKSFEYFHQNKFFLKNFSKSQCNIQKTLNISQEKKNVKKIPISHKRISGSLNELINFYQKNQKGLSKILEKLDTKENHKTQIHESLLRNTTKFFVKTKEEFQKNNVINIPSRMDKCANPSFFLYFNHNNIKNI